MIYNTVNDKVLFMQFFNTILSTSVFTQPQPIPFQVQFYRQILIFCSLWLFTTFLLSLYTIHMQEIFLYASY